MKVKYRKDIDGLRAVAVIPVLLFHAGLDTFSGGFVGVDVFFVISGYLITNIILSEKERGTFSLVNFYERRARRILPALFLVMFVSLILAWLWLLPSDMVAFTQSLAAVSIFSSNILFWQTSGYWGQSNELIPLLHTWSLAVEEQYYLIFPLFLMLLWRFHKRWILGSFIVIAAISLALAQWGSFHHPTATFFLLITRGWELAIGACIAFYFIYRQQTMRSLLSHKSIDEVFGILGLLMIAYAVFFFDKHIPFPGFYALIPTIGTGLIILFSSEQTMVGRLLGLKPLVGIGLISYSAYLWHQPIYAFAKYRSMIAPSTEFLLALALLSIVLAYLSWRYVEKPFRTKSVFNRRQIFSLAVIGSIFFITVGLAGNYSDGWPDRVDAKLQTSIEVAKMQRPGKELCLTNNNPNNAVNGICTLVTNDDTFAYLMGDSHAISIVREMKNAFVQANIGLIQATERGCPPIQGVYVYESQADKLRCFNHNEQAYRFLQNNADIKTIILFARWAFYIEAARFNNGEGGVEPEETLYSDATRENKSDNEPAQNKVASFSQAYVDSVKKIVGTGKKVILVYPTPEAGWNVPRYITSYNLSDPDNVFSLSTGSTSYQVFKERNKNAYQALDRIGDYPNLFRVYPENIFCNNDLQHRCIVQKNGHIFYSDDDHLSNAGAKLIIKEIMRLQD